jgi:hypothetical protein
MAGHHNARSVNRATAAARTLLIYLFIVVKHKEQLTATNMYRLKLN